MTNKHFKAQAGAGATGSLISANTSPEFCTVTPGMLFSFSSTSTSSGTVSVSEMA
jgi:hypothetical protein